MSSQVVTPSESIAVVHPNRVLEIIEAAQRAPLKRARLCLHTDTADPIQEMVIAFARGSYVPPHRHSAKSESFHVLQGELDVVFFDDSGSITRQLRLSADNPTLPRIYRLRSALWHSVIIRSEFAVIHEIAGGPFEPSNAEFAPWAPAQTDQAASAKFLAQFDST